MFRVIQISDPHVVVPPSKLSGRVNSLALLDRVVSRIEQVLPKVGPVDALLVTGDIADRGDKESYEAFLQSTNQLGLPMFAIPGNHDLREPMRAAFSEQNYMPASGRINWFADFNGIRMIGLDTLVENHGGGIVDDETLSFLESILNEAGCAPVLLAVHHPPFQSGIKFMDEIGLTNAGQLARIIEKSKAEIRIVCGHVHTAITASIGGVVAMSAPGICTTFDVDLRNNAPIGFTTEPGGFLLHTWDDGFRSMHIALEFGTGPYPF